MTSTLRRLAMLTALVLGLSLAIAPAVSAHDDDDAPPNLPARIDLPPGFQPEGMNPSVRSCSPVRSRTARSGAGVP